MSDISDLFGMIVVGGIVWFTLPYVTGGSIGGGGGGGASGSHIYSTTGKTCRGTVDNKTIGCSSGGSAPTRRINFNSCSLLNYELTAKIKFGGGCGCAGDEATLKHLGPPHSDGNCCWALSAVMQDGSTCFGGEGPHPDTQKCQQKLGSLGNLQGKTVAIKSVIWKIVNGWHQELWVDKTGFGTKWAKMGTRNFSTWGNNEKTTKPAAKGGPQQIELRVDCSGANWISWEVAEIRIPIAGKYAKAIDPPELIEYAPQKPSKIEELEDLLSYHTKVPMPVPVSVPTPQPIVVETYLGKRKQRQWSRY